MFDLLSICQRDVCCSWLLMVSEFELRHSTFVKMNSIGLKKFQTRRALLSWRTSDIKIWSNTHFELSSKGKNIDHQLEIRVDRRITHINRPIFWGVWNRGIGAVTHWKNFLWKIIHIYIGVVFHKRFFQKGVTKKFFFFRDHFF